MESCPDSESENQKRRISRPRIQYSPGAETKKKQTLFSKKLRKKFAPQRFNYNVNESSTSAYSTRESSVLADDEDFFGVDLLSQKDLRLQLEQMLPKEFSLPLYTDLMKVLENELLENAQCSSAGMDGFLDEQEEIKLLESTSEVNKSPRELQPLDKKKDEQEMLNSNSQTTSKRMRCPAKLNDDYVYSPLPKSQRKMQLNIKSTTEKKRLLPLMKKKKKMIHQSPRELQSLDRKEEDQEMQASQIEKKKKMIHESPREQCSTAGMDSFQDEQEEIKLLETNSEVQIQKNDQNLDLKSDSQTTSKRMRRPAKLIDDYVYSPLPKSQRPKMQLNINYSAERKRIFPLMKRKKKMIPESPRELQLLDKNEEEQKLEKLQLEKKKIEDVKKTQRKFQPIYPSYSRFCHKEFFERISSRNQLNPFSLGIKKSEQFTFDYFYRQLFVSDSDDEQEGGEGDDVEIDCVRVADIDCIGDEVIETNPSSELAEELHSIMKMDSTYSMIDVDQSEEDFWTLCSERMDSLVDENTKSFLNILLTYIISQRHIDTVILGLTGGASIFHSLTMKNANRLRESLKLFTKSSQQAIVSSHCWLLRNLPTFFIASYLNLLRFLKAAGSNLSDHIIASSDDPFVSEANNCIREFISQKIYEPPLQPNYKIFENDPIPNVSLILVYPQITTSTCRHIIRAHETLFRQLLPAVVCCVEKVELHFDVQRQLTIEECAWMCIRLIRQNVREIVKRRPNDHIFLAGWGSTCWLNHKVITKVPGVSGILNFAFPTESACGSRGSVDDEICLTYPSTLFVVGEDAANARMDAIKRLRQNMIADTGLIVVGSANHNLLVSEARLAVERVTQFVVQRTIVEFTVQFIKQVIADLGPPKQCREFLKPLALSSIHEIDVAFVKPPTAPRIRKTAAEKKPNEEQMRTKVQKDQQHQPSSSSAVAAASTSKTTALRPTQIASKLPPSLQPVAPLGQIRATTALHSARASFSSSIRKVAVADPGGIKVPSAEMLNKMQFQLASSSSSSSTQQVRPPAPSSSLQDTIREEEEAAAALSLLK